MVPLNAVRLHHDGWREGASHHARRHRLRIEVRSTKMAPGKTRKRQPLFQVLEQRGRPTPDCASAETDRTTNRLLIPFAINFRVMIPPSKTALVCFVLSLSLVAQEIVPVLAGGSDSTAESFFRESSSGVDHLGRACRRVPSRPAFVACTSAE